MTPQYCSEPMDLVPGYCPSESRIWGQSAVQRVERFPQTGEICMQLTHNAKKGEVGKKLKHKLGRPKTFYMAYCQKNFAIIEWT